jgi:hypothetical protein
MSFTIFTPITTNNINEAAAHILDQSRLPKAVNILLPTAIAPSAIFFKFSAVNIDLIQSPTFVNGFPRFTPMF